MKVRVSRTKYGGVILTLEGDDTFASFHVGPGGARELRDELVALLGSRRAPACTVPPTPVNGVNAPDNGAPPPVNDTAR